MKSRNPAERNRAWRQYVFEGKTLEAIAVGDGEDCQPIPLGTLKRWAAARYENANKTTWHEQRAAVYRDMCDHIGSVYALRAKATDKAIKSGEAKDIFAAVAAIKALQGEGDAELRAVRVELEREKLTALRTKRAAANKAAEAVKEVTGQKDLTQEQINKIYGIYGLRPPTKGEV
jgi:hypothetical protein